MTDIKIPVSTPGAVASADQLGKVAVAADKVAASQAGVAASAAKAEEAEQRLQKRVVATAAAWDRQARSLQNNSAKMVEARRGYKAEATAFATQQAGGGRSVIQRLSPVLASGSAQMGMGGMGSGISMLAQLGPAAGIAVAAALTMGAVFRSSSVRVERFNEQLTENMKLDAGMNKQRHDSLMSQQGEAAKSFAGIRDASRFILGSQGAQGEKDVTSAMRMGGPDAVNALAELLKGRGTSLARSGVTGSGILQDVSSISEQTGSSATAVLKAMSSQNGAYRPEKIIKDLMGGMSQELFAYFSEQGMATQLGGTINRTDQIEAQKRGVGAGRTLNSGLVLGGAMTELSDLIDPMKKVVDASNAAIRSEIAQREALIASMQSTADFWVDHLGPVSLMFEKMGIESVAGKATREAKDLNGRLR